MSYKETSNGRVCVRVGRERLLLLLSLCDVPVRFSGAKKKAPAPQGGTNVVTGDRLEVESRACIRRRNAWRERRCNKRRRLHFENQDDFVLPLMRRKGKGVEAISVLNLGCELAGAGGGWWSVEGEVAAAAAAAEAV
jgi:hypothetical protein